MPHLLLRRHDSGLRTPAAWGGTAWIVAVLAVLPGCDPGWDYRPVGGAPASDGSGFYQVPAGKGRSARVDASLFGDGIQLEVRLERLASGDPKVLQLSLLDRSGAPVRPFGGSSPPAECKPSAATAGAAPGFDCVLHGHFEMAPAGCSPRHPAKRIVVAIHSSNAADELDLRVPMDAE